MKAWRLKACLAALAFTFSWPTSAAAADTSVQAGIQALRRGDFDDATRLLKDAIYPARVSGQELRRAREALAQAYFYLGEHALATLELRNVLRSNTKAKPDSDMMPPDFVSFYAQTIDDFRARSDKKKDKTVVVRVMNAPAEAPDPNAATQPASQPASAPTEQPAGRTLVVEVAPASVPVNPPNAEAPVITARSAPWYLKLIPFGVGQLANGDRAGGAVWLSVELALLGANMGLLIHNEIAYRNGYPRSPLYPALYWAQLGTALALYATAIMGVVDAFVWSPGRAEASVKVSATPVLGGGAVFVSGGFE